jgi:dihydrofolate reductase
MSKLIVFNSISLDGYFTDINGDMSFAHNLIPDDEWDSFVSSNASGGGILLFGRVTYNMMADFWPTPYAAEKMPVVADRMNNYTKIVFSTTLKEAFWKNSKLVHDNMIEVVKKMKREIETDMVILGSGSIVSQLTSAGLIDEFQFVVVPVILGNGRTMFDGIENMHKLKFMKARSFNNGNVVLYYETLG